MKFNQYIQHFIQYLLKGFGYAGLTDFTTTVFKIFFIKNVKLSALIIVTLGTVREFIEDTMGLDIAVIMALVLLICAEFQTGLKVAVFRNNERIRSRKIGRMILKIGVYMQILWVLNQFAAKTTTLEIIGFEVNPFGWLYYIVLVGIVFQMVISWLENLSALGYSEAKGIHGVVLRKFNQWFEFDGTKNGDNI